MIFGLYSVKLTLLESVGRRIAKKKVVRGKCEIIHFYEGIFLFSYTFMME